MAETKYDIIPTTFLSRILTPDMKQALPLLALSLLLFACKKGNDNSSSAYNGFKVDGVLYSLDSIEHNFDVTRRPLAVHSKDHGGAEVYFHFWNVEYPTADGVYPFKIKAVTRDSGDANACFAPYDRSQDEYCTIESGTGQSLSTLTITISGGKWSISLPATTIYDNSAKTLEIQAHE